MGWFGWTLIVIAIVLVAAFIGLYFWGRKMQKKQEEAQQQIEMMKQRAEILVIDKQRKKMMESGLPEAVIEQTPKYARRMKVPVVKCKIGPRIMTMIADDKVYDILPVKKTCTVMISGIYITEVKSVRGGTVPKPAVKRSWFKRMGDKAQDYLKKNKQEDTKSAKKK